MLGNDRSPSRRGRSVFPTSPTAVIAPLRSVECVALIWRDESSRGYIDDRCAVGACEDGEGAYETEGKTCTG